MSANPATTSRIHVVGQGVAGTALAWCLYKAGMPFQIWDPGHEGAATRVGAGIMNPITGQRLVPSWRWSELLPLALALYRDIEYETGAHLLRPFRIHRLFADEREERIFARKSLTGELGPCIGARTEGGFWIEGAWQVDSATLIAAVREHFKKRGVLNEEAAPFEAIGGETTIVCAGHQAPHAWFERMQFLSWEGAILEFPTERLDPGVILNQGSWVLPWRRGLGRCGSTYWPPQTSSENRALELEGLRVGAERLVGEKVVASQVLTGWRVATPDRRPAIGWVPGKAKVGAFLGLSAKGSIQAPFLAGEWVAHLRRGRPLLAEVDFARFWA